MYGGTFYAVGASRSRINVTSDAVAGVTFTYSPVLAALAGGTSGGSSNETAGVAVQSGGTRDADLVGSLIEAWEAWAGGSSADREGTRNSVDVLYTGSAHIDTGSADTPGWADYQVVAEEFTAERVLPVHARVDYLSNVRSVSCADFDDVIGEGGT